MVGYCINIYTLNIELCVSRTDYVQTNRQTHRQSRHQMPKVDLLGQAVKVYEWVDGLMIEVEWAFSRTPSLQLKVTIPVYAALVVWVWHWGGSWRSRRYYSPATVRCPWHWTRRNWELPCESSSPAGSWCNAYGSISPPGSAVNTKMHWITTCKISSLRHIPHRPKQIVKVEFLTGKFHQTHQSIQGTQMVPVLAAVIVCTNT